MDNVIVMERNSSASALPSQEDLVEPLAVSISSSSHLMQNDNLREWERNTNNSNNIVNRNNMNGRCLEPAARMIIQRPFSGMDVNPFSTPRDFDALKSEWARLESFSQPPGWPIPFIRPEECAHAGFFFLQDGDKVQCAFCRGVAGEWEEGDDPMTEHRRHFPRCPFICGLPVGNIPLGEEEEESGATSSNHDEDDEVHGIDVCGPYAPDVSQLNLASDQPASVRGAQPLGANGNEAVTSLGIKTCGNGPAHPSLVTVHARIKTFTNWPLEAGQTPENMAEAGFFYIGRKDHVKCFYCEGGLRNWEASDDPWLEHARWFANCTYVILNKGDEFVTEVNKSKPPVVSQQVMQELSRESSLEENEVGQEDEGNKTHRMSTSSEESLDENQTKSEEEEVGQDKDKETDLEEEVRKLREQTLCKICMDSQVGVVFLPCGHLVSCTRCATALSNCALCRQPIKAVVRTYLS